MKSDDDNHSRDDDDNNNNSRDDDDYDKSRRYEWHYFLYNNINHDISTVKIFVEFT